MTVSSLDRVLAFVGSTGSTTISFILPGVFYYRMTRPGGLLPRTPEDAAKDDDEDASIHSIHSLTNGDGQESVHSVASEESIVTKRRLRRREIRRKTALVLVVYGFVIMAVCLTINIVVGSGGH
jgi:Transmembrane amino acid transporter protein